MQSQYLLHLERDALERDAQSRIILGADIVAKHCHLVSIIKWKLPLICRKSKPRTFFKHLKHVTVQCV
jgi:hypothetical protein